MPVPVPRGVPAQVRETTRPRATESVARSNTPHRDCLGFLHYDEGVGGRTFAIGDIHGDLAALKTLFRRVPASVASDTVVFPGGDGRSPP